MDFKRIQILLVCFFVIFNLYLVYTISEGVSGISVNPGSTADTIKIEEELNNRGVTFENFSDDRPEVNLLKSDQNNYLAENISQLTEQNASIDSQRVLTSTFNQPIELGIGITQETTVITPEQFAYLQENLLSDASLFIQGASYPNYVYIPSERVIVLRMTDGDGNRIIDGTAELTLQLNEDYMLTSYVQTYQANISQLSTTIEMISEKTAVEILDRRVETLIPDDAQILATNISYYSSSILNDMNVYSPAWEFIYVEESGTTRSLLVDGQRGTVLNRNTLTYN